MQKEEKTTGLGCWDAFFARRLARRGPVEACRIFNRKSPIFSIVVEYKWANEPDVKLARQISNLLKYVKYAEPQNYKQFKKQILGDIKSGANGDMAGYRAFVNLINNPGLGNRYDDYMAELIDNSPKTREIILKLTERDAELSKFGLDFRSDYLVNDSKYVDILLAKLMFAAMLCLYDTEVILYYWCIRCKLYNDKLRYTIAQVLWPDIPHMVDMYRYNMEYQQEVCDYATKIYKQSVDDTQELYKQTEQQIIEKYKNIERYKKLIQSGKLSVFKK